VVTTVKAILVKRSEATEYLKDWIKVLRLQEQAIKFDEESSLVGVNMADNIIFTRLTLNLTHQWHFHVCFHLPLDASKAFSK